MAGWSLPQDELPGKSPLDDEQIYARRERVFLVFASMFVVASAMLPLLGFGRMFGVSLLVRQIGIDPPAPLLIPVGALAFPIALLALNTVNALYGLRRAWSLVLAGTVVWLGVLGLHWATDHVVAYNETTTAAFVPGVALVACAFVTCAVQVELFALFRRFRVFRGVVSALVAIAAGWGVVAAIAHNVPLKLGESITGIALAAAGYTWLAVIAGTLVLAMIIGSLATHLRFALRAPVIDDDLDPASSEPAFMRRR